MRFGLFRQQEKQLEAGHALNHGYARQQPVPTADVVSTLASNIREKADSLASIPILLLDWIPHFRAITDYSLEQGKDAEAAALSFDLGDALYLVANYRSAETYYERALAIREKVLGPEHPKTIQVVEEVVLNY